MQTLVHQPVALLWLSHNHSEISEWGQWPYNLIVLSVCLLPDRASNEPRYDHRAAVEVHPVNDGSYIQTVMHFSYFRKETNDIYMTLLKAPYWGRRNDDTSTVIIGRHHFDFLQSSSNTPKDQFVESKSEKAHIHVHFKDTGLKKQENDSIIHELPTPQHFTVPVAGIYSIYAALADVAHDVLHVFLSSFKSANMQPSSWAVQKIHFLCRQLLKTHSTLNHHWESAVEIWHCKCKCAGCWSVTVLYIWAQMIQKLCIRVVSVTA